MSDFCQIIEITQPGYVIEVKQGDCQILVQELGQTQIIEIGIAGPQGPAMPTHTHTQATPSAVWTVNHNLGKHPSCTPRTVGGIVVGAEIARISDNQLQVRSELPFSGTAYCI